LQIPFQFFLGVVLGLLDNSRVSVFTNNAFCFFGRSRAIRFKPLYRWQLGCGLRGLRYYASVAYALASPLPRGLFTATPRLFYTGAWGTVQFASCFADSYFLLCLLGNNN